VLREILEKRQIECTPDELVTVYNGLKDVSCNASLTQFDKELNAQMGKIHFARNKVTLQETWKTLTGMDTVRDWCTTFDVPILWIVPHELQKPIRTLLDVQKQNHTLNTSVASAIQALQNMDASLLYDKDKIASAFLATVGNEYLDIWNTEHAAIITKAKTKLGNDMSAWGVSDLITLQKMLKQAQQEKAKKEKLAGTKKNVRNMNEAILKDRVSAFLDAHPEYCDDFAG